MKNILFTTEGYKALEKEQSNLILERKDAVVHLQKAREMGDLSENGYYKASKSKLYQIDNRLQRLSFLIKYAKVTDNPQKGIISVGSRVTLESKNKKYEYYIVGEYEGDPSKNKISNVSPIGRELLGKTVGKKITVETPTKKIIYKIIEINP